MKRAAVLALAWVMLLVSAPTVLAADTQEITPETRQRLEMLKALDIADIDTETTRMDEGISQEFFLKMIIRCMFEDFDTDNRQLLTETARGLKLIGSDYSTVKSLTPDQAVEMALRALGYNVFDGYSQAPDRQARQSLRRGLSGSGRYITAQDAVRLICNMLEEDILYAYAFSPDSVWVKSREDETILSFYRNLDRIEDVVTDNGVTNLYGESEIGLDRARLGDLLVSCEAGQLRDYLGLRVVAYVRSGDKTGTLPELVYFTPEDNRTVTIPAEQFIRAESDLSSITYDDGSGRTKTARLSKTVKVIYNGEAWGECTAADLQIKNGEITLSSSEDSGAYDLLKITEYQTMVVRYVSPEQQLIVSEFEGEGLRGSLTLDTVNSEKHRILRNGEVIKVSQLAPGQLLTAAVSKSERVIDLYVSETKVTGRVTSLDKDRKILSLDGENYRYTQEFWDLTQKNQQYAREPELGKEYVAYLDFLGRVAALKTAPVSEVRYGYMTEYASDGVFNMDMRLRLFDQDGEWVVYPLRKRLRFNGNTAEPKDVYAVIAANFRPQLVEFRLTEEGEIQELSLAVQTQELGYDGFSRRPEEELTYIQQSNSFSNTVFVGNSAYMWMIPQDGSREELYSVGGAGNLTADMKYTLSAYNVDESGSANLFTVNVTETDLTNLSTMFALVTSVGTKLDSNGAVADSITCHIDKYSDESLILGQGIKASDIAPGDVVRVYLSPVGVVENLEKLWSVADGQVENVPEPTTLRNTRAMAVTGFVKAAFPEQDILMLKKGNGVQSLRLRTGARILVYYKDRAQVRDASLSELLPNDYAVLFSRYSSVYNVVVIRD